MKTKQIPKISISVSREHEKYLQDIKDSFVGLDVNFSAGLMRFSEGNLPMQIMIFLGGAFVGGAAWDILKLGIKKLFNKFSNIRIVIRDDDAIMYGVRPDFSVNVVVVPDRMKEFEKIKSIDNLIDYLSSKEQKNIHSDWKYKKLEDFAKTSSGGTPKSDNISYYQGGTIPWLTSGEVRRGKISSFNNYITKNGLENSSAKIFPSMTVLVAMYGATAGQIGILEKEAATNQAICGILPNERYSSLFLYYYFTTKTKQLLTMGAGAAQPNISQDVLRMLDVHFPPLPEQNRIVAVLETWDKAIERLTKKIELKKNIKKGLMQKLLTGKFRLPGFGEDWQVVRLGDICEIKKGQDLSKGKLSSEGVNECILYGELYTKYNDIINEIISRTDINEGIRSIKGDVLIPASTTTNAMDLAIAVCLNKADVLLGGDINILRQKKTYNSNFLALYLTYIKKHDLARLAQGITIVHLYGKDCKKIKLEMPNVKEQDNIANIIITADKEIKMLKSILEKLQAQKKYLLNNLITGAIRTPEDMKV